MFTVKISSNSTDSPVAKEIPNIDSITFNQLLKRKWDEIHAQPDVFRYKVNNLRERIVDHRYILLLNPDRGFKRRQPEFIDDIRKPFNHDAFHFNKTSPREHLFTMHESGNNDNHMLLVNVSPISRYHTLLCPSVDKCLPQIVTEDSIRLVLEVKFLTRDRELKIGFNSLCAFASVNHLHYHLIYQKNPLHVQYDQCTHIKGPLYLINNIVPSFCFEVTKEAIPQATKDIFRLTEYLVSKSIGHNILITYGEPVVPGCKGPVVPGCKGPVVPGCKDPVVPGCKDPVVPGCKDDEVVRVLVIPRLSTAGMKQLASFNVAVLELCGWFPIFNPDTFESLSAADLENELSKWKLPNFEEVCDEVRLLY